MCGLPTLATEVGGSAEVVSADVNALVGAQWSTERIVSALQELLERPLDEGKRRRDYWHERYSAQVNYPQWARELVALT